MRRSRAPPTPWRSCATAGIPLRLVTNTTMRPRRSILERLERLGIEAEPVGAADAGDPRGAAVRGGGIRICLAGRARRAPRGPRGSRGGRGIRRRGDRRRPRGRLGLRGPEPRLPAADGRGRADRPAEEPLLGDRRGALSRCGAVRLGARVRDRAGRRRSSASPRTPSSSSPSRSSVWAPTAQRWSATTSRPMSAARWTPGLAGILVRTGKYREDLVRKSRDRAHRDG